MKKHLISVMTAVLLLFSLCGCGNGLPQTSRVISSIGEKTGAAAQPGDAGADAVPDEDDTYTSPAYSGPATVLADIGVLFSTADRGDDFPVLGEDGAYYLVSDGERTLYVEKRLARPAGELPPESVTIYTKNGAGLHVSPYLDDFPSVVFARNRKLTLIDSFGGIVYARTEEGYIGYIDETLVGEKKFSSGSDKGSPGGGRDGGDIGLSFRADETSRPVLLSASAPGVPSSVTVLADGTELYLTVLRPGDEVQLDGMNGNLPIVLTDSGSGTVPSWAVLPEGSEEYVPQAGTCERGAQFFRSWRMAGECSELKSGTEVRVLFPAGRDRFCVELDGERGYMYAYQISIAGLPAGRL